MEILDLLVGLLLGGLIVGLTSYFKEKGKNLAALEDIEKITREVESVKQQNALILEVVKSKHQMKLVAMERRLQAHQEAFSLWRKMLTSLHIKNYGEVALECQDWYNNNCLYLDTESRGAFLEAYSSLNLYGELISQRANSDTISRVMSKIVAAGDFIVEGAELPSLGKDESKLVEVR